MARILVIDDEALIRETIKTMLQLEGHEVALARHDEEGCGVSASKPSIS